MCGRVALHVMITIIKRYDFIHFHNHIPNDIRIGIFVNGNARCGVGNKNEADAVIHSTVSNGIVHLVIYIKQLYGLRCANVELFSFHSRYPPYGCWNN